VSKLRIMLADDHETVREGLKMIVNAQDDMEVVGFAGDGHETVARAQELLPDVLVMDISMSKPNGLKATEKLFAALQESSVEPAYPWDSPYSRFTPS
jgi:two-component system response regulator NreC